MTSPVKVVTTTLFNPSPTGALTSSSQSHSSVPIGAIVGGILGGSALAILVTVIWVYWGKQIKKTKRKQQEELDTNRTTRYNTLQNARISGPKNHSYRPLLRQKLRDQRVKFVGDEKPPATQPPAENIDPEKAKHMLFDNPNTPHPSRPPWLPAWSLPLKKNSQNSVQSTTDNAEGSSSSQPGREGNPASREGEKPITHKPSNISAVSAHSNVSGDSTAQRPSRVPSNIISAALGGGGGGGTASNRSSLRAGDRHSNASLWSHLFRAMPGARTSQYSSGENAYQPSETDQSFPVGTAV